MHERSVHELNKKYLRGKYEFVRVGTVHKECKESVAEKLTLNTL